MNKIFIFACFLLLSHEKEKNTFLGNNNSNMGIASSKILVGSGSVRFNSRNTNNGELNLKDLNKIKSTSNLVNKTIEITEERISLLNEKLEKAKMI